MYVSACMVITLYIKHQINLLSPRIHQGSVHVADYSQYIYCLHNSCIPTATKYVWYTNLHASIILYA